MNNSSKASVVLGLVTQIAGGTPHFFDDLHLFERRLQRVGRCADLPVLKETDVGMAARYDR